MEPEADDEGVEPATPAAPARRTLPLTALLVPIGALVIASNIGSIIAPSLVKNHPLWLLSLTYLMRWQVAATANTAWWSWGAIAFVRLLVPDPFFYLLGRDYGDRALNAIERNVPSIGRSFRQFERLFHRARYPVLFLAPNNPVCLLAGADRMNVRAFAAVNVAGTLTRLVTLRIIGNAVQDQVSAVTGFLDRYKWWFVGLSLGALLLTLLFDRRKGAIADVSGLRELRRELSDEE